MNDPGLPADDKRNKTSRCVGGVYRCDAVQRATIAARNGFVTGCAVFVLDGQDITDKSQFLRRIAEVMQFPDYFGNNWDALNDCLTDPPAGDIEGTVLVLDHCDEFAAAAPEQWDIARRVFAAAADYRRDQRAPLFVVIAGDGAAAADANPLPRDCA